ncbi:MAG TPA: hypothetical protein VFY43_00315, partial [Candidatus Limnocylindria bacterium]|nr:hypothetical protein [Candidatus Limnocylindria bacterium]
MSNPPSGSMAAIAAVMDPVNPHLSLRELAHRHRWPDGGPPPVVSLRVLLQRHEHPQSGHHRFLAYNTFLLEGWVLSLCADGPIRILMAVAGMAERDLIKALDLSPADVLKELGIKKGTILDWFDISPSDLANGFQSVHKAACDALDLIPVIGSALCDPADALGEMLDHLSPQQILDKFEIGLDAVLDKIEELGLDPMPVLVAFCRPVLDIIGAAIGIDLPSDITFQGKPELGDRANEIGGLVGSDYDVAALCEVFSHDRRLQVTGAAKSSGRAVTLVEGPDDQYAAADGGLALLALDQRPVIYQDWIMFDGEARGDYFRDADAWANKGVLLSVLDVGVGRLEVYSTHLVNGGDLLTLPLWVPVLGMLFPPLSAEERIELQMRQTDQLVAFYHDHHDRKNVAMIVGDFNVAAHTADTYGPLMTRMSALNMRDIWPFYREPKSPPGVRVVPNPGPTSSGRDQAGQSSSTL